MYKVFIVEDEVIVREGLRDNILWEQNGFILAGEAGDGEIALPMIRRERADILITDIRMPFMDGLSLCKMVKEELPDIKILILSGYDDFEYARKAIEIGVSEYLTKPVTRKAVTQALERIRKKLDAEREKDGFLYLERDEMKEYEQFLRRRFFEDVFSGSCSVSEIYQQAGRLGLDMTGPFYRVMLLDLFAAGDRGGKDAGDEDRRGSEAAARGRQEPGRGRIGTPEENTGLERCRADITRYFLRHPQFLMTSWINNTLCIILRGDTETVQLYTRKAMDELAAAGERFKGSCQYFLCYSVIVERASRLKECYEEVRQYFSCRYMNTQASVVTEDNYYSIAAETFRDEAGEEAGEDETGDILPKTLDYIHAHYTDEAISLHTAAAYVNVSPGYLSALFSQKMDQTFVEYITAKRIEKAKQLLRTTSEHTSAISALVGYKDPNYFRFVFKKIVGCTPREYRRQK